ncbi:MAG: tetraacyldisaccharide 4'-kinase [Candidatus Aminicenantes bacterium]|nr:tetraacyldisaccharide 4'-kinase [Candidatus Aminicenantes bacterium]MDH5742182.1 tetraacyldisaccharide 4'-kinase [Candidatus Aminicenantes bacterium]
MCILKQCTKMVYSPQRMNRVLIPLSFAYQVGCRINNFLIDRGIRKTHRAPLSVISVGNIAFGGSEKTPLAMNLISFFLENGFRPALVTRGYKGKWEKNGGILSDGNQICGTWREAGDEPFMVSQRFPRAGVFVGQNRLASCEKAHHAGFNVAILDDGFQHRRLQRNLDIVLYNPDKKVALREPLSSLRRANIIMVKREGDATTKVMIRKRFSESKIYLYTVKNQGFFPSADNTPLPVEHLEKKRLLVVCGIARPERFLSILKKEGMIPTSVLKFPDHHAYPSSSLKKISDEVQKLKADAILTTEKDHFKMWRFEREQKIPVYHNRIELEVDKEFYQEILSLLKEG